MKGAGQIEKRPRYLVERDFRCGALQNDTIVPCIIFAVT
jgi:hypothetical protein